MMNTETSMIQVEEDTAEQLQKSVRKRKMNMVREGSQRTF